MKRTSLWLALPLVTAMLVNGCATAPSEDENLERTRAELDSLKSNETVQAHGPTALLDAEQALNRAEAAHAEGEEASRDHYLYLARRHMEKAQTMAQTGVIQQENQALGASALASELEREQARSQQLEAELAALEAKSTTRGMVVTLDDLFFETAGARIASGASRTLDKVVGLLEENPDQRVFIEGHTDSVGDADYNQSLSERRARAVREEMVARGIDADRLVTRGYGESRPIASNANEGGRQLNRRVEIVFPNNHQ